MSDKGNNMFNKKIIVPIILILLSVSLVKGVTVSCGHSAGYGNYQFTNYDSGDVQVKIDNKLSSIQILPENPFTLSPGESKIISLRSQYSDTYIRFFVMYKALYGAGFSASLECPFYATKSENPVVTATSTTTTTVPECRRCLTWFRGTCVSWENICDTTTTTILNTTTTTQQSGSTTTTQPTTTTIPSTCVSRCIQEFRGMCLSWSSCGTTTTTITTTTQKPATTTTQQTTTTTIPPACVPRCLSWFRRICLSWSSCGTTTTTITTTTIPQTTTTIPGSTTTTLCQPRCVQWFRVDCIKWEFC